MRRPWAQQLLRGVPVTGFSPQVRDVIIERGGGMCERCGALPGTQAHHRRPRGMGGSKRHDTNTPANGLWACDLCHDWVERNRTEARKEGWLIRQADKASETKVLRRGEWVLLDDGGGVDPYLEREADRWFCGTNWPSRTKTEPHVCVSPVGHEGVCRCACGLARTGP